MRHLMAFLSGNRKPDIHKLKAEKMAQTERFLSSHRRGYQASAPIGFKSRSESSYYLAMRPRY